MNRDTTVGEAGSNFIHAAGRLLHLVDSACVLLFLVSLRMLSAGGQAHAQDRPVVQHLPEFAVISIRPTSGTGPCGFTADGFRCESISAKQLAKMAYHIDTDSRISAVPAWAASTNYQIVAKVDEADLPVFSALPYDQRVLMLKPLLESRFNLAIHWIGKEFPVYTLTVVKGGSKLRPSLDDAPTDANAHVKTESGALSTMLSGKTDGKGVPIEMLIQVISPFLDRIVLDDTKLTGKYDFSLQLPRPHADSSGVTTISFGGEHGSQTDPEASDPSEPSIYSAIADLGLKLQPQKASLQVLVVDRLSQPSSN